MSAYPTDPTTPPVTEPGLLPTPTSWPKVLGIFCIVIGAIGLIYNFCGLIGAIFQGALNQFAFSAQGPNVPAGMAEAQQKMADAAAKYQIPSAIIAVVSMALAGWLLGGGIMLLKRRRGALTLVYWAPLSVLVTLVGAVVTFLSQQAMGEAMTSVNATTPGTPNMAPMMSAIGIIAAIAHLVFRLPLPLVVLGFLAVGKRREEAKAWGA